MANTYALASSAYGRDSRPQCRQGRRENWTSHIQVNSKRNQGRKKGWLSLFVITFSQAPTQGRSHGRGSSNLSVLTPLWDPGPQGEAPWPPECHLCSSHDLSCKPFFRLRLHCPFMSLSSITDSEWLLTGKVVQKVFVDMEKILLHVCAPSKDSFFFF